MKESGPAMAASGAAAVGERPKGTGPLGRTIASGTAWSGFGRFGVLGFGLIGQALTARLLVPSDFGAYSLLLSWSGWVALVAQLGLPQSTVRHIARANSVSGTSKARSAIAASVKFALLAATSAAVLTIWPLGPLIGRAFPDARVMAVLGLFAALVGVRLLENIAPELFRGLRDFRSGSLYGGFLSAAFLCVLTVGAVLWMGTAGLDVALVITIAASIAALAAAAVTLWRRAKALPVAPRSALFGAGLLSPAIWIASVINYSITQLDLWVVGAMGNGEDIALYSAAFRLSTLVTVPLAIVNFVVPPLVVQLLAKKQPGRLQLAVQTVTTIAGAPAFFALLALAILGPQVSGLVYGDFYASAGLPLALLTIGKIASVLTGPCAITLIMAGHQRVNLQILAMNFVLTLPLQVVGYRVAGLAGLALATSVGFAAQNIHQAIVVRRRIGVSTHFNPAQTFRLLRDAAKRGAVRDLLVSGRNPKNEEEPGRGDD
jgi:O-antigen/teichoic acid export membrane protein